MVRRIRHETPHEEHTDMRTDTFFSFLSMRGRGAGREAPRPLCPHTKHTRYKAWGFSELKSSIDTSIYTSRSMRFEALCPHTENMRYEEAQGPHRPAGSLIRLGASVDDQRGSQVSGLGACLGCRPLCTSAPHTSAQGGPQASNLIFLG